MNTEISNLALYRPTTSVSSEKAVVKIDSSSSVNSASTNQENVQNIKQAKAQSLSIVKNEDLQESVSRINEFVQAVQRDLEFSIDEATGKQVITVLDRASEEVIRQIPTEAVLAIADNIETLKGILFSAEA